LEEGEKLSCGLQGWLEAERRRATHTDIGFLQDMQGDRIGDIQMRQDPKIMKGLWKETRSLSENLREQVNQQNILIIIGRKRDGTCTSCTFGR
jgi:hypothetical protein